MLSQGQRGQHAGKARGTSDPGERSARLAGLWHCCPGQVDGLARGWPGSSAAGRGRPRAH